MVTQRSQGETEFRFRKEGARQVYLVGDFNPFQESRVPMDRDKNDEWVCRLHLPQGVYRFRYLADGEWHTDRDNPGLGWAPFDCNSLTVIPDSDTTPEYAG